MSKSKELNFHQVKLILTDIIRYKFDVCRNRIYMVKSILYYNLYHKVVMNIFCGMIMRLVETLVLAEEINSSIEFKSKHIYAEIRVTK